MDLGLKDRVAIVAAASRGIGFACALELAREGARVFLCSRIAEHASEAAQKIHEKTGANVAGFACDVTNNAAVEAFVQLAAERGGRIDILRYERRRTAGRGFCRDRSGCVSTGV